MKRKMLIFISISMLVDRKNSEIIIRIGNLSMKQGRLFCFVLSHWDLPNHGTSCCALGIESSCWLGLRLFGPTMWKLLIIESFFKWKSNQNKTKNHIRIWRRSLCCWKAHSDSNLIESISQFSKLKFGKNK
jgi:hypothetical protein